MRKKFLFLLIPVILVVFCGVIYLQINKTNMEFAKEAEVRFIYGDTNTMCRLDQSELEAIKAIFDGKKMEKDNPSCGFTEDVSVTFNKAQTFCIACDTCPIVYWKEKDRYIRLTEEEKTQLYHLLQTYGFFFPCE